MPTLIRSATPEVVMTLPAPYSGIIPRNGAVVVNDDPDTVLSNLGGADVLKGSLQLTWLPPGAALSTHLIAPEGEDLNNFFLANQAHGDLIRRSASAWERFSAKSAGYVVAGDGADVKSLAMTGNVALSIVGGALVSAVSGFTLASQARGDLIRLGASAWERFAAKSSGYLTFGNGTDVISGPMTGDGSVAHSGGNAVLTLADQFRVRGVTSDATVGVLAITAAMVMKGLLIRDPNGGNRSDTLPTAAAIVAAMPGAAVGSYIDFTVLNVAGTNNYTVMTGGAGLTLSPAAIVVGQLQSVTIRFVVTNATPSSEAVSGYLLSPQLAQDQILIGNAQFQPIPAAMTGEGAIAFSAGNAAFTAKHALQFLLNIPSASGVGTDGFGGNIAGCEGPLDLTKTELMHTFALTWYYNTFVEVSGVTGTPNWHTQWELWPSGAGLNSYVAFGGTVPFCELQFSIPTTVQTYTGAGVKWEYWNGTMWATLTLTRDTTDVTDGSGHQSFGGSGVVAFVPPSDWAASTLNGQLGYWIHCIITDATKISQFGVLGGNLPYYCAPTAGTKVAHKCTITSATIRDSAAVVHTTQDIKFFLFNFTKGTSTAALTFVQDRRSEAWTGLALACDAGDSLGVVLSQEDGTNEMGPFVVELNATLA